VRESPAAPRRVQQRSRRSVRRRREASASARSSLRAENSAAAGWNKWRNRRRRMSAAAVRESVLARASLPDTARWPSITPSKLPMRRPRRRARGLRSFAVDDDELLCGGPPCAGPGMAVTEWPDRLLITLAPVTRNALREFKQAGVPGARFGLPAQPCMTAFGSTPPPRRCPRVRTASGSLRRRVPRVKCRPVNEHGRRRRIRPRLHEVVRTESPRPACDGAVTGCVPRSARQDRGGGGAHALRSPKACPVTTSRPRDVETAIAPAAID